MLHTILFFVILICLIFILFRAFVPVMIIVLIVLLTDNGKTISDSIYLKQCLLYINKLK
jgi:hypothetical protein